MIYDPTKSLNLPFYIKGLIQILLKAPFLVQFSSRFFYNANNVLGFINVETKHGKDKRSSNNGIFSPSTSYFLSCKNE